MRLARGLNALWKRSGEVLGDRYHARALRTPREVRAALLYVLHNARRHGLRIAGIDPYTSGSWFDGWSTPVAPPARERPNVEPSSWLLRSGWKRHGLIGVDERPGAGR